MKHQVKLLVNGELYEILVKPGDTLLKVLREDLALTGTKMGCDTGDCGACTVTLNGSPVNSCLVLAVEANGMEITTIEGLAEGTELHPIQEAFITHGAVQCGYCTAGMILSAKALLDEKPNPSEREIKAAIAGNLCRCTGYTKIIKSIAAAAKSISSTAMCKDRVVIN